MFTDEGKNFIKRKPVLCSLLLTACVAFILYLSRGGMETPGDLLWGVLLIGLCLIYPLNCILIAMKTIRYKIIEWCEMEKQRDVRDGAGTVLQMFQDKLTNIIYVRCGRNASVRAIICQK